MTHVAIRPLRDAIFIGGVWNQPNGTDFYRLTNVRRATMATLHDDATMTKLRDNEVQFRLTGISIQAFDVTDHSITPGQPYEGVTVAASDKLNVRAGREKSEKVGQWFKSTANTGVVIGCSAHSDYPKELNFAILGNLKFISGGTTYNVNDVLLAQGRQRDRSRNNWWIGGPSMTGGGIEPIAGIAEATAYSDRNVPIAKVAFVTPDGCESHFDVTVISI
jgi:hypothetical protein